MNADGAALARAAAAHLGVPFRLHGRGGEEGVDCVGLLALALRDCGRAPVLPRGYGLRNTAIDAHLACLPASGFAPIAQTGALQPGDVVLVAPGPAQQHLLIALDEDTCIHAHAGLRRVSAMPVPLPWPIRHRWRLVP